MLSIENIDINKLKNYEKNAKKHPEKQIQQIAESISKFGFNNPILIDENNEIIAGHGRFQAAKIMQLESAPVIRLSHLSDAKKKAYRLADNKISENGGWDTDILKIELDELLKIEDDFDITCTGFSDIEIDVLSNPPEEASESLNKIPFIPENEIVSKSGDIWQLGVHRIICGDSLIKKTFSDLMQDDIADMVIQDPPYNVKIEGHVCNSGNIKHNEFAFASGEMKTDEFTQFLKTNFKLCKQFSKPGSLHYNFMDWRHITEISNAGNSAFDSFINMCVWTKSNGGMGSLYRSQHELCFIFKNGKESHTNNVELGKNGRYRTNVWNYPGANAFGNNKKNLKLHPTVKPVEMIRDAILDVSKRNDIILDTFLGSGSALIAAEKSNRKCRGIEFEPLYIDTAIRRFESLFKIDAIHLQSGKTYKQLISEKMRF